MKRLIYIPVIHTEDEMGTFAQALKEEYTQRFGLQSWDKHAESVEKVWVEIREALSSMPLDLSKTRIYQDGLPVCGIEMKIAKSAAEKGSKNFKIILELVEKGGKLEGTESSELLLQEYGYLKEISQQNSLAQKDQLIKNYEAKGEELLSKRDRFISDRILETLKEGETGLLFIGLKHKDILPRLKIHRDIEVRILANGELPEHLRGVKEEGRG